MVVYACVCMHGWDKRGEKGRGEERRKSCMCGGISRSINHTYIRTYIPGM